MNEFMNNRYVQLASLMLGIGVVLYLLIIVVLSTAKIEIPAFVPVIMAFGASIWFVWKFIAYKIG